MSTVIYLSLKQMYSYVVDDLVRIPRFLNIVWVGTLPYMLAETNMMWKADIQHNLLNFDKI